MRTVILPGRYKCLGSGVRWYTTGICQRQRDHLLDDFETARPSNSIDGFLLFILGDFAMRKIGVCAVIPGIFCLGVGNAGNIDCVRFLRVGDQKICMKTLKETSPALVAEIDDALYYASTTPDVRGDVMFEYNGTDYSLYNYDDTEYELIHWLNGADALADGVWRDRVAIGGAMDFENHGCVWNDDHTGYYSADGFAQYFVTSSTPMLDFGTDWYVEITAQAGEPLGTLCPLFDVGSLTGTARGTCAEAVEIIKIDEYSSFSGKLGNNTKPGGNANFRLDTGTDVYVWGDISVFAVGYARYSVNQSRSFIKLNDNRYYGQPFNTLQCNRWSAKFYLFRGISKQWTKSKGFTEIYRCGPTTIYDIKVWRKK